MPSHIENTHHHAVRTIIMQDPACISARYCIYNFTIVLNEADTTCMHSCQVSWFDQDSPGFVMPVLVLFWLREKY